MIRLFAALAFTSLIVAAGPSLAAPPPIEAYGKLPAMEMVTLSPSGERYAFVADDGKSRNIYVLTTDNKPLLVLPVGKIKVHSLSWAGDNYILVYKTTTVNIGPDWTVQKDDLASDIVFDIDKRKAIYVFHGYKSVNQAVFGYYGVAQIDGRWYGYFGGETLQQTPGVDSWGYKNTHTDVDVLYINTDLYRVDLETGALRMVAVGEADAAGWLVDAKGEVLARKLYDEKRGDWRIRAGGFGGRDLAAGRSTFDDVDLLGLGRDAGSILLQYHGDKGWVVEELPLDGTPAKPVTDEQSLDAPIRDRQTDQWIGMETEGDAPVYRLFSPAFEARVQAARKAFPGYRVRLTSWSADFNRMIVFTDGGDDSGTYWIIDIAKKSADPLGGEYPLVGVHDVGLVKMIDYKAADGLALRGVLTLPPGRDAKGLPLVVMPHGGPQARDYPGFDWWAQAFASRGYAVFQPNFRGSSGYGEKFVQAGYGEWGRKMQTDISDGVAELARQGTIDPKRACIVGASYGGYAALAGVTVQQGLYRCAVSVAGVADPARMLNEESDAAGNQTTSTTRYWKTFMGVDKSGWGSLKAISPVALADKADAPILLIHGKDDTTVLIAQSDAMERALKHAGKPVERITLDGTDHYLLLEQTRVATLKASVDFVAKYNPADPASVALAAPH